MKKLVVIFCLFTTLVNGQEVVFDSDRECQQYEIILSFMRSDSLAKVHNCVKVNRYKISPEVANSGQYTTIGDKLIWADLDLLPQDLYALDSDSLDAIKKRYETEARADSTSYLSKCLVAVSKEKRPNVFLRFSRYNNHIVVVSTRTIYKKPRHSQGVNYIFRFNEENIPTIYRGWYME